MVARIAKPHHIFSALPHTNKAQVLVRWLFDPSMSQDTTDLLAFQSLSAFCIDQPENRRKLLASISAFISLVEGVLADSFPSADETSVATSAYGIISIYFSHDGISALGPPDNWRTNARTAANLLLNSLEQQK